jgi:hypothetical protein
MVCINHYIVCSHENAWHAKCNWYGPIWFFWKDDLVTLDIPIFEGGKNEQNLPP